MKCSFFRLMVNTLQYYRKLTAESIGSQFLFISKVRDARANMTGRRDSPFISVLSRGSMLK